MRIRTCIALVAACASIGLNVGCVMSPCGKIPAVENAGRVASNTPRVVRSRNLAFSASCVMKKAWPRIKAEAEELDSCAFRRAGLRVGVLTSDAQVGQLNQSEAEVSLSVECRYRIDWSSDFLRIFSLTLVPCPRHNDWIYDFTVRDKNGKMAQYRFEDGWVTYCGLSTLFALPWKWTSDDEAADSVLENVYANLFVAMKRDGFFDSAQVRNMENSRVSKIVDADRSESDRQRKDLESLKEAGVISEEEYKCEMEKIKKEKR